MKKILQLPLDTYNGRDVYMAISVLPAPSNVQGSYDRHTDASDWCVALAVAPKYQGSATELVTVDTAHGYAHIDRYYTAAGGPSGANKLPVDWSLSEAENWVQGRYADLLKQYERNHGSP